MKTKLLAPVFVLLLLLGVSTAQASHILGGELLYTHISDSGASSKYLVTLTLYGDCSSNIFHTLTTDTAKVNITNNGVLFDSILLYKNAAKSDTDVSPICAQYKDSTTCNGGTYPGVVKYVYEDTVVLNARSAGWKFIFYGYFVSSQAGRSASITNLSYAQNASTNMYLIATLDNTNGNNSSPQYSTTPTPFYCINVAEQYNQGAVDVDLDSLDFELSPALSMGVPVNYVPPFTATSPLTTTNFTFNSLNGQMNFSPSAIQDGDVVTTVREYRNGRVVGSSMREMTFIILDNCRNNPPQANVIQSSVVGANALAPGNVINVCAGVQHVAFQILVSDEDSDQVNVTINNIPATAAAGVSANNTISPIVNFSWNTMSLPLGTYTLYITLKDNHCPITSTQTIAYTLNIVDTSELVTQILAPTQCLHKAYVEFDIKGGVVPRSVAVVRDSTPYTLYNDNTGVIRDSFAVGTYDVYISSPFQNCSSIFHFEVVDSGMLSLPSSSTYTYCRNQPDTVLQRLALPGDSEIWYDASGSILQAAPQPNTAVAGVTTYYVIDKYKSCTTGKDTVNVIVNELPVLSFPDIPSSVCVGDKVVLTAQGGSGYTWSPLDSLSIDAKGQYFIIALVPQTFEVSATNEGGCKDSATVSISNIEVCCRFSYPNAFTPDNNGRNDRYHVVTYGNLDDFDLSIYDRWGRRVYHSFDPDDGWDGKKDGKPCDIGTYFYYLRAHCVSGHKEEHHGDVTLVR